MKITFAKMTATGYRCCVSFQPPNFQGFSVGEGKTSANECEFSLCLKRIGFASRNYLLKLSFLLLVALVPAETISRRTKANRLDYVD